MKCSECQAGIDQWLQHQLNKNSSSEVFSDIPALHTDLLIHIQQCEQCRIHYEAARLILFPNKRIQMPPEGVQERVTLSVLAEIERYEAKQEGQRTGVSQTKFIGMKKLLLAAAVVLMVVFPFIERQNTDNTPLKHTSVEVAQVTLEVTLPEAETVVVVGDWNNWDPQLQYLAKGKQEGTWSIEMELEKGKEYRYQFVIDGETWIADPNAYLTVEDGFGGTNSILEM